MSNLNTQQQLSGSGRGLQEKHCATCPTYDYHKEANVDCFSQSVLMVNYTGMITDSSGDLNNPILSLQKLHKEKLTVCRKGAIFFVSKN